MPNATDVHSTPLIGRAAELEQMQRAIEAAREGNGCIMLISGEAGIGKSRLVGESLRRGFEALLPDAPTSLQAAKRAFDGLTAREREVAAQVALGKTNKAIAAQLVVSERTVEKHVENAMGKLSFTSRSQLAVWAAERRLA
jgi:DNA-binding NarL/FixJ family response regulator